MILNQYMGGADIIEKKKKIISPNFAPYMAPQSSAAKITIWIPAKTQIWNFGHYFAISHGQVIYRWKGMIPAHNFHLYTFYVHPENFWDIHV